MKKPILITALLCFCFLGFSQLEKSTIKNIPLNNVYGWEGKKSSTYFNSDICEQSYYSIRLTGFDLSVKNEKKLWNKYSPFLYIQIKIGEKEYVKIIETANITKSKWNNNSNARSVDNLPLIGPFPYQGENITVTVNLYAYKIKDNLETAINSISSFTSLFPNKANAFVQVSNKIKESLLNIFPKCESKVSYSTSWIPKQIGDNISPNIFKEGYVIIHPTSQKLNEKRVHINNLSKIKYRETNGAKVFLYEKHIDHIVLKFEHYTDRRDFQTFPFFEKYREARLKAIKNKPEEMEKHFSESMNSLYADNNFTYHNQITLHNKLYKNLLIQIRNHREKYKGNKTPVTACSNLINIDYQIATNTIREKLIEQGIIQPGDKLNSYEDSFGKLTNENKLHIEKLLKSDFKIINDDKSIDNNIDSFIKNLDKPDEIFEEEKIHLEQNNFQEENLERKIKLDNLQEINEKLDLNISDEKLIELKKNLDENDIQKIKIIDE